MVRMDWEHKKDGVGYLTIAGFLYCRRLLYNISTAEQLLLLERQKPPWRE